VVRGAAGRRCPRSGGNCFTTKSFAKSFFKRGASMTGQNRSASFGEFFRLSERSNGSASLVDFFAYLKGN